MGKRKESGTLGQRVPNGQFEHNIMDLAMQAYAGSQEFARPAAFRLLLADNAARQLGPVIR